MCFVCAMTRTFDPGRHGGPADPVMAALTETTDAPYALDTPYTMGVGDSFSGSLGATDLDDMIAIEMTQGETYVISMTAGTLTDPYLWLFDGPGDSVASNDDAGPGARDSQLVYTAETTGTHYINPSTYSYDGSDAGTYTVTVETGAPLPVPADGTLDALAAYLVDGYWQDQGEARRAWADGTITYDVSGLTAEGRDLARHAFDAWEMVADLTFVEVASGGDITFDDDETGAYATATMQGGAIVAATINVDQDWLSRYGATYDSYAFSTYIHEIGHAIGLGHQGPYNASANFPSDAAFGNDSYQVSVMSYFSQSENTTVAADYAEPMTAMLADIVAAQTLYGAPDPVHSPTAGDTVWGGPDASTGTYLDLIAAGRNIAGNPVAITVYDIGGIDRIDVSDLNPGARLDLNDGAISDIGGRDGALGIARGTIIEAATTGPGDDTVLGNAAGNRIETGAGADRAFGNAGADTLIGGAGADTFGGGPGDDSVVGGDGNDALYGSAGADTLAGGAGADTLGGAGGNDSLIGNGGSDVIWTAAGDDIARGGWGDDTLGGSLGDDTLYGAAGRDELWGAAGHDSVFGGDDADLIGGFDGNDTISGDGGADEIWGARGNDSLTGGSGNDQVGTGGGDDTADGGAGNDTIYGGAGDDSLLGGSGDDLIYGGTGDDTIEGGQGTDTLFAGQGADVIVFGDGDGADQVNFFSLTQDTLRLDAALWGGGLSEAQVASLFGADAGADFVLDFGDGDVLALVDRAGGDVSGLIDIV